MKWPGFTASNVTDIINGGQNAFRIQATYSATTNRLQVIMPGTNGTTLTGSINMTSFLSAWHNVAVVMDQAGTGSGAPTGLATVYVDGTAQTMTFPSTSITHTGSAIFVTGTPAVGSGAFAGGIDDVRIYGRALTTTEITALNSGGAQ